MCDAQAKFVSQVLRSTEQVWTTAFQERGATYQELDPSLYRVQVFNYASHPLARDIGVTAGSGLSGTRHLICITRCGVG